jgi:serine/threonine-protein kinase
MTETELVAGHVLGRYELLLPIAKGGMAQVWAARLLGTRGFRKIVAVKTILKGCIDDTRMEQMFLEEATLASQIHHPNVVETLELGEHDGTLYLVMEWVDGEPLHFILAHAQERGGLPLPIAVNIVGQACKGLHAAHDLRDENGELVGLVHRDISPQNVLVTYSGTTKLVDFGIAKATSRVGSLTEAGELKGKFAYMSPEQVTGAAIDRRSDVFALGVLLYMLSAGRHPFKGDHPGETVRNICSEQPALPPRKFVRDYPPALEAVVMKALNKNVNERWASAHELLAGLEEALPEYLEGSFEIEVAKYLKELLGHRLGERRKQLRLAEERADGIRLNSTGSFAAPVSQGSLGAVAMDRLNGPTSQSQPITLDAETPISALDLTTKRSRTRRAFAIAAVPAAMALGAVLGYQQLSTPQQSAQSARAAASPVPPTSLPTAAPRAQKEPEPAQAPPPSAAAPAPAQEEREVAAPERRARGRAPAPAPRAPARNTAPAPAAPAPAASAPSAESKPDAPRPAGKPNMNAWDPTTFGGRH